MSTQLVSKIDRTWVRIVGRLSDQIVWLGYQQTRDPSRGKH